MTPVFFDAYKNILNYELFQNQRIFVGFPFIKCHWAFTEMREALVASEMTENG